MSGSLSPFQIQTPDYTDKYNTQLSPGQEWQFQNWVSNRSATEGRDVSKDLFDYDLRGAWLNNAESAANGHLPDTWKKPNHMTFSDQSMYSAPGMPGGQWSQGLQPRSWQFQASPFNTTMNDPADMQQYFSKVEQGNALVLPQQAPPAQSVQQQPSIWDLLSHPAVLSAIRQHIMSMFSQPGQTQ